MWQKRKDDGIIDDDGDSPQDVPDDESNKPEVEDEVLTSG